MAESEELVEYMLTTVDNPFDPFDQFDQWLAWDARAEYHTPSYLARILVTSSELSAYDQVVAQNRAIDEILMYNITGTYRKVGRPFVHITV